jgi:hypothetical protein
MAMRMEAYTFVPLNYSLSTADDCEYDCSSKSIRFVSKVEKEHAPHTGD